MSKQPPEQQDMAAVMARGATARLTIDLAAVAHNYNSLAALANKGGQKVECAAVVKADGYGTGAHRVATHLFAMNCRTFFIATAQEGIDLRRHLPDAVIYVLDGLFEGASSLFAKHDLRPVLGSLEMLGEWSSFCGQSGKALPAALHIDTGMNRLGVGTDQQKQLFDHQKELLANIKLELIMSHLACADEPDHPRNRLQLRRFKQALKKLPPARASLANSAGILLDPDYHFDLVRPGIALYGGQAVNKLPNPMQPVAHLTSHIAQIRTVSKGDMVGYGAAQTAKRKTRLATIPVGYADGYHRALGATDQKTGAHVCINGHRAPLLGRVSMDLITVDITDIPQELASTGTPVELLGAHVLVDDLADIAGTIGYEILTSLAHRYERHYAEGI